MRTARFNPDGECKAWCIDKAVAHFQLTPLPQAVVEDATPILKRAAMFQTLGFEYLLGLPRVALLNPRIAFGILRHRGRVHFSTRNFMQAVRDFRGTGKRYCIFYELGAEDLYGVREGWVHTVVECGKGYNCVVEDGLREVLEAEETIPKRPDGWYAERLGSSRCGRLLITEA
jgi:hypothetical protein